MKVEEADRFANEQLCLFLRPSVIITQTAPCNFSKIHASSTILDLLSRYRIHLVMQGVSEHTLEGYCSDVKELGSTFPETVILNISSENLYHYIDIIRKKGRSPKTLHRKVASLKHFFRWLTSDGTITYDPSESVIITRPIPPLPDLLFSEEIEPFKEASRHSPLHNVLVLLYLEAGLKRSEALKLTTDNIDISNSNNPIITVDNKVYYRRRTLRLSFEFADAYRILLDRIKPTHRLFNYTTRNLNIIIHNLACRAGITHKRISCESLRDTYAVRCLKSGEKMNEVFKKLGLSPSTTIAKETHAKYKNLLASYH